MEVRIRFASECCIKGDTLEEIKRKWDSLMLFAPDGGCEFYELETVEDAETYDDIMSKWLNTSY